ncbi:MAG: M23 family metallopeptidase [Oxalobacteraceae bacterium]
MKWAITFLIGALVGAIAILIGISFYLKSFASEPVPVPVAAPLPTVVVPSIVPVDTPVPSAIGSLASGPAGALAPAYAASADAPVTDQLLLPVAGISASQLDDTFNQARGTERRHEALDILAPKGTQVLAVADGKIAKLFDSKPGGLTVYQFDTSEKFAYYYAHLDHYAAGIKEGTVLKRGDLVGYVGTTGNADPAAPHLHFAIFELGPEKQWWKGTPINPYPLLGGAKHP